jgi:hypothetical protein
VSRWPLPASSPGTAASQAPAGTAPRWRQQAPTAAAPPPPCPAHHPPLPGVLVPRGGAGAQGRRPCRGPAGVLQGARACVRERATMFLGRLVAAAPGAEGGAGQAGGVPQLQSQLPMPRCLPDVSIALTPPPCAPLAQANVAQLADLTALVRGDLSGLQVGAAAAAVPLVRPACTRGGEGRPAAASALPQQCRVLLCS